MSALQHWSNHVPAVTYAISRLLLGSWQLCQVRQFWSEACLLLFLALLPFFSSRFAQVGGGAAEIQCAGCSGLQCPEGHLSKKNRQVKQQNILNNKLECPGIFQNMFESQFGLETTLKSQNLDLKTDF